MKWTNSIEFEQQLTKLRGAIEEDEMVPILAAHFGYPGITEDGDVTGPRGRVRAFVRNKLRELEDDSAIPQAVSRLRGKIKKLRT